MIETMNLQDLYSKETAKAIFEELDIDHQGKILAEHFIDFITRMNDSSNFKKFFEIVAKELISPSEKIIVKLKKLKKKAYIEEDKESIEDIDW